MVQEYLKDPVFNEVRDKYFIGVDPYPKPLATICNIDGELISSNYGPVGPWIGQEKRAVDAIRSAVTNAAAIRDIDIAASNVGGMIIGLPGTEKSSIQKHFLKWLNLDELFGNIEFRVVSDVSIALHGIAHNGSAMMVRTGVWNTEFGRNILGDERKVNGFGASSRLARAAIDAVYDAAHGSGEKTTLLERFQDQFRAKSVSELADEFFFFDQTEQLRKFHQIVKIIGDEASGGDNVSKELCSKAGDQLAHETISLIKKLKISDEILPVGLQGDLWQTIGNPLNSSFLSGIKTQAPNAYITDDIIPPAHAAALMAIKIFGDYK